MKIKLMLFLFVFIAKAIFAQTQFELKCKGEVPQEILSTTKEGYTSDVTTIKGHKNKKVQKEYYLETNTFLNQLLRSGSVLFGDSISDYVNKVGVELLKNHKELQGKIKFFVFRSPYVNAFSTQKGYIFINIGLIAQLEDEAQLAYILAHEIVHFTKNHGINQYIENSKMKNKKGDYKKMSENQKDFLYYYRSKTDEFEADTLGLREFIVPSDYSIQSSSKVFDILLYSDFHYQNLKFESSYFNFEKYSMPSIYFVDTVNPIVEKDDYDDIKETHPNIKRRREEFNKVAAKFNDDDRKPFIISKTEFLNARNLARLDLMHLEMLNSNPAKVFYSTYVLKKNGLNSDFINYCHDYALYAVYKGKLLGGLDDNITNAKTEMGEVQQVYHAFSKMGLEELNLLALCNLIKNRENASFSEVYSVLISNLIHDLIAKHNYKSSNFNLETASEVSGFKVLNESEYKALKKIEQIKYDKKLKEYRENNNSVRKYTELVHYLYKNEYFMKMFYAEENQSTTKNEIALENKKPNKKMGTKEPINNLIVYQPEYNYYKFGEYDPLQSEETQRKYIIGLTDACKKTKIEYHILSSDYLTPTETDLYNDLYAYDCWFGEMSALYSKGKVSNNSVALIPFSQYMVDAYFKKVGTSNILISEGSLSIIKNPDRGLTLWVSIVVFPLLPVGIYSAAKKTKNVEVDNMLINGSKGQIVSSSTSLVNFKNGMSNFKSFNYRYFKQLKNGIY